MRVHVFQHVPFEGLGLIEPWLRNHGHEVHYIRLFAGETPRNTSEFDWLIVMGGPMNVYQVRDYPWLWAEQRAIASAIETRRKVLGICLGAQLIADVLGAKVFQNTHREIGWFPIQGIASNSSFTGDFQGEHPVLHWHGDTFELPPGTKHLARSAACENQAFSAGNNILGLQFHLEMGAGEIAAIAEGCEDELRPDVWVQPREKLLEGVSTSLPRAVDLLHRLLERLSVR